MPIQALLIAALLLLPGCSAWHRMVVKMSLPQAFEPQRKDNKFEPIFDGPDEKRKVIPIKLIKVARGFNQPTDLQFVPNRDDILVVLEKTGIAKWENLVTRQAGELLRIEVLSDSEQGLLGLAFHPRFAENGKFYIDYTVASGGKEVTRISEWQTALTPGGGLAPARGERVLLEVVQPYANHNAGQILFDATGHLLITLGDGGWRADPHGNGQNPGTLLGSILRIDVDNPADGKPYGIPADNPFVGQAGARPEIWAIGMRNPWRASLDPQGRLVAGDVGQELWEEVDIIERGRNYGWNVREGCHCFEPAMNCPTEGMWDPVWEYKHGTEGQSVTGGYVYTSKRIPELTGKYVFGDFISGRLWALELPAEMTPTPELKQPYTLGQWPILPVTFGRNPSGDLFVADFGMGDVYALVPGERE